MTLYFITGNKNKHKEFSEHIPELKQLDIDLEEIQSLDPKKVIEHKLLEAKNKHDGEFIVEDTSLELKDLNGLPGTFIKFFLTQIGPEGIAKISLNSKAIVRSIIGLYKDGEINYFEGIAEGKIVSPKGESNFGYDKIFLPEGYEKTYAELDNKNEISQRVIALKKLKQYLQQ